MSVLMRQKLRNVTLKNAKFSLERASPTKFQPLSDPMPASYLRYQRAGCVSRHLMRAKRPRLSTVPNEPMSLGSGSGEFCQ
jgi:hypothetical protein